MRYLALITVCAALAACTSPKATKAPKPAPEPAVVVAPTPEPAVETVEEAAAPSTGSAREYINSHRSIDD